MGCSVTHTRYTYLSYITPTITISIYWLCTLYLIQSITVEKYVKLKLQVLNYRLREFKALSAGLLRGRSVVYSRLGSLILTRGLQFEKLYICENILYFTIIIIIIITIII